METYRKKITCPVCDGEKKVPIKYEICRRCHGDGKIYNVMNGLLWCPKCGGSGDKITYVPCENCKTLGWVYDE